MAQEFEAIFENGAIRPLQPVQLTEHQTIHVTINEPQISGSDDSLFQPMVPVENDDDDDDDERPWRGVFAIGSLELETIFTKIIPTKVEQLPPWQPQITIESRWVSEDEK